MASRNNKQIVAEINTPASPSTGATSNPGKDSSNQEDSLRKGKLPASGAVTDAKEVSGKTSECVNAQVGQNGNPHKRDAANWGISRETLKTQSKLD